MCKKSGLKRHFNEKLAITYTKVQVYNISHATLKQNNLCKFASGPAILGIVSNYSDGCLTH